MFIIFLPIYFIGYELMGDEFVSSVKFVYWRIVVSIFGLVGSGGLYLILRSSWSPKINSKETIESFGDKETETNV
ncbi:MAG: hypothetical protein RIF46_14290, partial [Cyclobacteriaceae bacterium]